MSVQAGSRLTQDQIRYYHQSGYYFPLRVLAEDEVTEFRGKFLAYLDQVKDRREKLPPRDQYLYLSETHTFLSWVYRIVSHPKVLDAVESILGPDILVWGSRWFSKMPGEKAYVSWHQDATYWGLHPPHVTTAWIALSESSAENGCVRVIPGTHEGELLPQKETYAPDNVLSRGQEIAVEVDESKAIDLTLGPGEMSLHHIGIVHGSDVNKSQKPRIGIGVRYITPEVVQDGKDRSIAMLVRGKDGFGHFELFDPPTQDVPPNEGEVPKAVARMLKSVMPAGWKGSATPTT